MTYWQRSVCQRQFNPDGEKKKTTCKYMYSVSGLIKHAGTTISRTTRKYTYIYLISLGVAKDSCELLLLPPLLSWELEISDNMLSSSRLSEDWVFGTDGLTFFFSFVCFWSLFAGFCWGTTCFTWAAAGSFDFFSATLILALSARAWIVDKCLVNRLVATLKWSHFYCCNILL